MRYSEELIGLLIATIESLIKAWVMKISSILQVFLKWRAFALPHVDSHGAEKVLGSPTSIARDQRHMFAQTGDSLNDAAFGEMVPQLDRPIHGMIGIGYDRR